MRKDVMLQMLDEEPHRERAQRFVAEASEKIIDALVCNQSVTDVVKEAVSASLDNHYEQFVYELEEGARINAAVDSALQERTEQ